MRLLSSLIIVTFAITASFAQEFEWHQVQRPSAVPDIYGHIGTLFGVDHDTVYCDDFKWRTTDHGNTWNFRSTGLPFAGWPGNFIGDGGRIIGNRYFRVDSFGILIFNENSRLWERTFLDSSLHIGWNYLQWEFNEGSDGDLYAIVYGPNRFLRSSDKGQSWIRIDTNLPAGVQSTQKLFWISSIDHRGHIFLSAYNNTTVYISTDKGISWDSVYSMNTRGGMSSLAHLHDGTSYAVTYSNGIWLLKSDMQGHNWRTITSLTNSLPQGATEFKIVASLKGTLFGEVFNDGSGYFGALLRSTDEGLSWHPLPKPNGVQINHGLPVVDSAGVLFIHGVHDTINSDTYLAGGVYISTDEGEHWIPRGYPHFTINSIVVDKLRAAVLTIGSTPFVYSGGVGVDYDAGVYRLNDSLRSVSCLFSKPYDEIPYQITIVGDSYILFAKKYNLSTPLLYSSNDIGASWIEKPFPPGFPAGYIVVKNNVLYVFTTAYDVYKSTDVGSTWLHIITGTNNFPTITSAAVSPKGNYFIGAGPLLYRDKETYFTRLEPNLTASITCIVFDSIGNTYVSTDKEGVIFSSNNGSSWKPLRSGLPEGKAVYALMVTPHELVLAATEDGLYVLNVGDTVWRDESKGIYDRMLFSLCLQDDETYLVGSLNSGLYINKPIPVPPFLLKVKLPSSISVEGASQLSPNYPNPFSLETKIQYEVIEPGWVTLEIFSLMGEKLMTLENGYHASGTYESSFSGNDIPSGTYIYRLKIAQHAEDRLMIKQ